jgi:probable lipoprotein NlpC
MTLKNLFRYGTLLLLLLYLPACGLFNRIKKDDSNSDSAFTSKKAKEVIANARNKTGSPYKYGGKGDGGYDCSGLVFTSFQEAGIKLPRSSNEQATIGKDIAFEKVRPGDLVFFATKKGEGTISHVGIVTEVKDKEVVLFIHAANSGVQEDNLYAPYYFKTFVKAKRVE